MEARAIFTAMGLVLLTAAASLAQDGWYVQDSGSTAYLIGVFTADPSTCWATGSVNTILYTSNGGDSWSEQSSPNAGTKYGVFFLDPSEGWVVGEGGDVLHTTDAGQNWYDQSSGTNIDLWAVHFVDANNGWVAGGKWFFSGNKRIILHTSNGGASWTTQHYENYASSLHGIFFTDLSHGYAVGEGATILATTDGGASWVPQDPGITGHLEDVYFTSPDTGFVVGQYGRILHTTDGGANWDELSSGTSDHLACVWFIDDQTGWVVGGSNTTATILQTADGGATWVPQDAGIDDLLRGIHFSDASNGWAVGVMGTIIHTTTGGWTAVEESEYGVVSPLLSDLAAIPNPFSKAANLSFDLGGSCPVRIRIFDLSGRLAGNVFDGTLGPGSHSIAVDASGLESGVYLARVDAGPSMLVERLVRLR